MSDTSITGRDGELMIEALAHTIESYYAQHESDCRDAEIQDMILILEALTDDPNSHRNLARARLEMIAAWAPAAMKNLRMKGANR